jgi:hypothetical protein
MSRELDASLHFCFLIIAILCWVFNKHRKISKDIYLIGLFLLAAFLFDGIATLIMLNKYLARKIGSNLFLYHILIPIQFVLIMLIYNNVIKNRFYKKITVLLIPVFTGISIMFSFAIQPLSVYNSYSILIKHAITILFVLIYFYELLSTTPYTKIYAKAIFWISIGFLFHSTFNILLEGVSNYLHTYSNSRYGIIFFLYSISNYCLFALISIGLLVSNKNKLEVSESEPFPQL